MLGDDDSKRRESSDAHLRIQLSDLRGSTLEVLAPQAARIIADLVEGADGASVTKLEGDNIVYIAGVGGAAGLVGRRSSLVNSFTGRVIAGGRGQIFDPSSASRSTASSRRRAEKDVIRAGIIVPIASGGIVQGTLGAISHTAEAFDETHLEILTLLAIDIGRRLQHGRDSAEIERSHRRARVRNLTAEAERHVTDMSQIRASVARLRSRVEVARERQASSPDGEGEGADVVRELHQAISYTEQSVRDVARFEVRIEEPLARPPRLPPGALWQSVMNLLRNALQAIPPGAPEHHRVTLSAHRSSARLIISVEDSGHGMDEATRRRATEPFFSTRDAPGMGLTIARQTAEAAGGELILESHLQRGSTVILSLPLR